jgi:branched-chain amino acid transport system permease protein
VPKRRLSFILIILTLVLGFASPASAEGEQVQVKLQVRDSAGDRQPVVDVAFTVTNAAGEQVGTGVTNEDGIFILAVPEAGSYTVTIDPTTLPEGVSLTNPDRTANEARVDVGGTANTLFALTTGDAADAASTSTSGITVRRVAQLSADGAKLGLFLGMAAIGLSLIFGTTGLTSFAHSEMMTFGMLTTYFFNYYGLAGFFGFMASWPGPFGSGVNLIFATMISVVLGGCFGWLLDASIFAPLRRRGTSLVAQLVITIGLSIFLRYLFLFIFGGSPRFYADYTAQRARTYFGLIDIADKDLLAMGITILVLVGTGLLLQRTRIGKAMRAVSDNRDLAESSGIDVSRVIRLVWVAGGAMAALGGTFLGLSENVSWLLGFRMLLLIFAGVILGGLGTAYGALVGCLLVGLGIQLSTLFIPIELKNVGALGVMILVLLVRPQGILGRAERIG